MIGVPSSLENSNNTNENKSIEISNTTESKKLSTPPILNPKPKSQEKIILPIPEKFLQAIQPQSNIDLRQATPNEYSYFLRR